MQTIELLPGFLRLDQAPPVFPVVLLGSLLELLPQLLFVLSIKENLILSKVT